MKKRGMLLLTCVALIGSISNVYGESFNAQSPGMDIFNTVNEDGLDKQDVDSWLGQSNKAERMFHSTYEYNMGDAKGTLKIRYDDTDDELWMSEIVSDINEDIEVGRILWKEDDISQKRTYMYQIANIGELKFGNSFENTLNDFYEVPYEIDDMPAYAFTSLSYRDYPMYGKTGTLLLKFNDGKMKKDASWCLDLREGEEFSDYSTVICEGWLTSMDAMLDSIEIEEGDNGEAETIIMGVKKICNYYQEAFQKNDTQRMKKFESALKWYYMGADDDTKFGREINKWLDRINDFSENMKSINIDRFSDDFVEIWMTAEECQYTWDEMIRLAGAEEYYYAEEQPVSFCEVRYDENLEEHKEKYIKINYNPQRLMGEE